MILSWCEGRTSQKVVEKSVIRGVRYEVDMTAKMIVIPCLKQVYTLLFL
jgi:hypothetical protein